jgi:uncharacterized protein DUF5671
MTKSSSARDVFMYLLVLVVLTMSTVALGALVFDLINIYLPDTARPALCAYDGCAGALNTELAVLIVAFPVLVWSWRFLRRDLAEHPNKGELWMRKWLLYPTLFVAGIAAIIDLIQLLNAWLNGELTLQFLLKILTVLLIAGSTFYYFLRELHPERRGNQYLAAWGAALFVVAAIAAGVYTSAPWEARARAIDRDRVYALQNIQSEILNFRMAKGRLPATLEELNDPIRGFVVPRDPETAVPYEYAVLGTNEFQLCAVFTTASRGTLVDVESRSVYPYSDPYVNSWEHPMGRTCFDRVIDPDLYPPKPR